MTIEASFGILYAFFNIFSHSPKFITELLLAEFKDATSFLELVTWKKLSFIPGTITLFPFRGNVESISSFNFE